MDIKQLSKLIRNEFGPAEIRVNKESITITFSDTDLITVAGAESAMAFFLRDNKIEGYDVVGVRGDRVKLVEREEELKDIDFDDEEFSDEDIQNLRDAVFATTAAAHEASQLEVLQTKALDYEVDEFLTGNLSAALELLPNSKHTIQLDEVKNLLAFAFLTGKWSNARMADLEVLAQYFNNRFEFHAEQFGHG
jgi:hypothetical protein